VAFGGSDVAVLRRREFRLLLGGQAVSVLGDRVVAVALAFAVLEVGGSVAAVGLVLAARTAPLVASVLIGGVVADRVSRRTSMVVADVVRVATQGAIAVLLLTGAAEVWMLAALSALTGLATGFFTPASTGLLAEIVPPAELQQANAVRSTAVSIGEIAGPILAGLLVAGIGAGAAIGVDATTFALSAVCLALLPPAAPREPRVDGEAAAPRASFLADLRAGWAAFAGRRWVWTFVAYFAAANAVWAAWGVLGPVVADDRLGGAAVWGAILGAMGVGALLGSLVATRIDPARPLVVVALMEALFVAPFALLPAGVPAVVVAAGAFLSGVGMTVGMSVWESTLQRGVPIEALSRVSSYDWFGSYAFYPLGMVLWGPVAAAIGTSGALWIAFGAGIAAVSTLLTLPDTRERRRYSA
jgi:predicted MFS family arabinose efflux permease